MKVLIVGIQSTMRLFAVMITALLLALALLTPVTALADSSADFLFEDTEEFYAPDSANGPWVYYSENLTVCIKKSRESGQLCYIADIYIRNNEKAYTGWAHKKPLSGTQLPQTIARQYGAVFGIMADYVGCDYNTKGVMIRGGKTYYNRDDLDVLAVLPTGEMEIYKKGTISADELLSLGVKDSFAFGPILVRDKKMTSAVSTHHLKGEHIRTGIGKIEDGHYIAVVSRDFLTFKEFAKVFISCGCEWAYNFDGGYSTAMVIMGDQINHHTQRTVSDIFLIGKSELASR